MEWKKIVADYFTFTRGNRIAILAILAVMLLILFLPDFLSKDAISSPSTIDTTWVAGMKRIEQRETDHSISYSNYNDNNSSNYQYDRKAYNYYGKSKGALFEFDPNTLSEEDWKRLGLRDKTIGTIQNFLSKGGKFRKPEDLSRIYGLFPNEYERIAPYIRIQPTDRSNFSIANPDKKEQENQSSISDKKRYSNVDINSVDANELMLLPGIGPSLSTRITNFRDKLGGFYSIDQIGETFGLPDSTFQKIKQYLKLENSGIRTININTVTIEALKAHPYLKWSIANAIIAYRNEHGSFSKVEDLKKIMIVTDELFNKISPYLSVQ